MARTKSGKRSKYSYGQRPSPLTTEDNMQKIKELFDKRSPQGETVSFKDMQKATKHKWVRGFFNALKMNRKVEAVRKGRKIIGYRYANVKAKRPTNDNKSEDSKAA